MIWEWLQFVLHLHVKICTNGVKYISVSAGFHTKEGISDFIQEKGSDIDMHFALHYIDLKFTATCTIRTLTPSEDKESPLSCKVPYISKVTLEENEDIKYGTKPIKSMGYDLLGNNSPKVYEEIRHVSRKENYLGIKNFMP